MAAWSRSAKPRSQRSRATPSNGESAAASLSNRSRMRSRSSAAAASVKVMAAMRSRVAAPPETRFATRPTKLVVLPVPAPASTKRVSSSPVSIRCRAASSCGTKGVVILRSPPVPPIANRRPGPPYFPGGLSGFATGWRGGRDTGRQSRSSGSCCRWLCPGSGCIPTARD